VSCIISRSVATISTERSSFKFVAAKVMLSALETVDNRLAPLEGCLQDFPFFCLTTLYAVQTYCLADPRNKDFKNK
jgi:hypothetical protein